jgi:hypothetical protein
MPVTAWIKFSRLAVPASGPMEPRIAKLIIGTCM